jgi:PAS domain S-box-containing protein
MVLTLSLPALAQSEVQAAIAIAAVVLLVVLGGFLFVRALRAQVRIRTAELERRAGEIEDLNAQLEISNEELQTSKEELESANEELSLLNTDLEARNRELSEINEELARLKTFKGRIIATLPAALLVIDRNHKVTSANRRYEEIAFADVPNVEGRLLDAALPDDLLHAGGVLDAVAAVFETDSSVSLTDVPTVDRHGNERHFDVTVAPLVKAELGDEGLAQYLIALVDVSEKHRLQRAVREQERYLRRLVENPLVAIVVCTPQWRITLFNEGAERLTGRSSTEMRGRDVAEFLIEGWDACRERLDARRPVESIEATARDRNGNPVPVALFAAPLEDEGADLIGHLIIGADLRERKAIEENLLRRNRELGMLYDVAQALDQSLDLDELIESALQRLLATFPADCGCIALVIPNAPLEQACWYTQGLPACSEQTCSVLRQQVLRSMAEQRRPQFVPNLQENMSSAGFPGDDNGSAVFAPLIVRDELVGMIAVISRSFYAYRNEEIALLTSVAQSMAAVVKNVRLYNDLTRTLADLKRAQEELLRTEKLRALGELAAGVAHDFNNALGIILGTAQCLAETTEDVELVDGLKTIEKAAKDGARTVERVQEFVRTKSTEGFAPLDLNPVVRGLAGIAETRLKQEADLRSVHIALKVIEGKIDMVEGDERDLREALTNIVFNAIDAMPKGGTLTLETNQKGRQILVRITDTGIGMSAQVRSQVFDPFFTTKGVKGTGLGMSVAYGIIKQHRGTITIESEPGQGTTVTVSLPAAAEAMRPIPEPEEAPTEIIRAVRVLLIEDNIELNRIIRDILTRAGHTVEVAHSGPEGLAAFSERHHDLVITDVGMPGMSGWEVAKAVKESRAETGVVLVTGWDKQEYRYHPHKAHADALLAKPIDKERLLRVINKMLLRPSG